MATEIRVPTLGESVSEATIGRWFKKPGDAVKADEPILELETDKVTLEAEAPKPAPAAPAPTQTSSAGYGGHGEARPAGHQDGGARENGPAVSRLAARGGGRPG